MGYNAFDPYVVRGAHVVMGADEEGAVLLGLRREVVDEIARIAGFHEPMRAAERVIARR